jgi:hypothetical protein
VDTRTGLDICGHEFYHFLLPGFDAPIVTPYPNQYNDYAVQSSVLYSDIHNLKMEVSIIFSKSELHNRQRISQV